MEYIKSMRSFGRRLLSSALLLGLLLPAVSCTVDPIRLPVTPDPEAPYSLPALDDLWAKVKANNDGLESRDIAEFLLQATAYNWSQNRLKLALTNLTDLQIRDQSDPEYGQYYGNFHFAKGNAEKGVKIDENAAEFCMEKLAVLRKLYYGNLNAENKAMLDEMIRLAIVAMQRHNVAVTYTNIYVMKMWSLSALGEATGDNAAAQEGYGMLRTWMQELARNGVAEYNSPTYSGVAAVALGCMAALTDDATAKQEANIALEYYSLLLFGNYFKTGMYLGGPHSRDYNYFSSRSGTLDGLMAHYLRGWDTDFYSSHAFWTPTGQALSLIDKTPRTIVYKTGADADRYAISFVGDKVNMGSAGHTYGYEDKNFVINLSSAARKLVVNISSVLEGRNDPYAENQVVTGQGHTKPRHLRDNLLARAQRDVTSGGAVRGSEMVFLLAADGSETSVINDKVRSHVIIPASKIDGMWNGNTQITDWSAISEQPLSTDDKQTFFLRFEDVAVGIRYLLVQNDEDAAVPVSIVNKKKTVSNMGDAMHLSAQLSAGTPAKGKFGAVAMWWRVEEGITDDAAFERFRKTMIDAAVEISTPADAGGTIYSAYVTPAGGEKLGVAADRETKKATDITGGITLPSGSVYAVDGTDVANGIFARSSYAK